MAENPEKTKVYRAKWKPDNKRRREEFRKVVDAIKSVPCKDCDESYPPRVMEFDHRDPKEKTMTISRAVGKMTTFAQQKKVLAEIKKCDIVCANCHRLREIERDSK